MGEFVGLPEGGKQGPVPTAWRKALKEIVRAIAARDATFSGCSVPVEAPSLHKSWRIIDEMGVSLAELPDETWSSSVCIRSFDEWDVIIDLYDVTQGRTDLILPAKIKEGSDGIRVTLDMIHVP